MQEWLKDRPKGTKVQYGNRLYNFCESNNITPEQFQALDQIEARNLVWNYVSESKGEKPREAIVRIAALKSFYRNKDGVQLPFDSRRGGKHYIRVVKKKAKYEIVPDKEQAYRLVDATANLRDRALILTLFESGVRVNSAISLNVGHVRSFLFPQPTVPLVLKITSDLDSKLKGAGIPFYITGLQGEAVEALRNYVRQAHTKSLDDTPLFLTRRGKRITQQQVHSVVKEAARKAGLNEKGIWTHSLRKAFRKVLRRTDIDDECACMQLRAKRAFIRRR
jgi:site-specific recombinase XerD